MRQIRDLLGEVYSVYGAVAAIANANSLSGGGPVVTGGKRPAAIWPGLVAFVVLSFTFSWISIAVIQEAIGPLSQTGPVTTRLFTASLVYFLAMGWQPLLAVMIVLKFMDPPAGPDSGMRAAKPRYLLGGALLGIALVLSAAAVAWLATAMGMSAPEVASTGTTAAAPTESATVGPLVAVAAIAGTLLFVWLQAFIEEIGWRGYFLARLMRVIGPWGGLVFHGLVWGLWYAPIILVTLGDPTVSASTSGAFVVTCFLLGILLGWLRLASGSVLPAVIANVTVTIGAGMPYFLVLGLNDTVRAAVLGPFGWCLMLLGATIMASASRWRAAVRVPAPNKALHADKGVNVTFMLDQRRWIERGGGVI